MKNIVLVAAFLLCTSGAAFAQQRHDYISELDTNQDNAVSRSEFEAMATDHFHRQDLNHDGQLGADERHHGPAGMTVADYVAQAVTVFDRVDANHDGSLVGDEVTALRESVASNRPNPS